jgi:hypothetical protein
MIILIASEEKKDWEIGSRHTKVKGPQPLPNKARRFFPKKVINLYIQGVGYYP